MAAMTRLLPVPECRIGNVDLFGRIDKFYFMIKFDFTNLIIREHVPVKLRIINVDERILGVLYYVFKDKTLAFIFLLQGNLRNTYALTLAVFRRLF